MVKNLNQDKMNQKNEIARKKKITKILLIIFLSAFWIGGIFLYLSSYYVYVVNESSQMATHLPFDWTPILIYYIVVTIAVPCPFLYYILGLGDSAKKKEIEDEEREKSNWDNINYYYKHRGL